MIILENMIFADFLTTISLKEWVRVLSLYMHLVVAGLALSTVLLADVSIAAGRYTKAGIHKTARITSVLLATLWLSGLLIIYLDTGFNIEKLASSSKLMFKLICVCVLTVNGYVLHRFSLPVLTARGRVPHSHALLLGVTGALSTSHWLMSAFIGASTPLAKLPLVVLLSGYVVALGLTLLIGIAFTPIMRRRLSDWRGANESPQKFLPTQSVMIAQQNLSFSGS